MKVYAMHRILKAQVLSFGMCFLVIFNVFVTQHNPIHQKVALIFGLFQML